MFADFKLAGWAAAGLAVAASYFFAFHLGGASTRAASEAAHAAQLALVVTTLEAQRNAALTESNRRQGIIDAYDIQKAAPPAPAVAGLAQRVLVYSHRAACGAVPGAAALASGAAAAAPVAGSDASAQQLSGLAQSVYDACAADAEQMKAMIDMASPAPTSSKAPP